MKIKRKVLSNNVPLKSTAIMKNLMFPQTTTPPPPTTKIELPCPPTIPTTPVQRTGITVLEMPTTLCLLQHYSQYNEESTEL